MPDTIARYYEPFLGGGAVYLSIHSDIPALVNDKSVDLIRLYKMVANQDEAFFAHLNSLMWYWQHLERVLEVWVSSFEEKLDSLRRDSATTIVTATVNEFISLNEPYLTFFLEKKEYKSISLYVSYVRKSLVDKISRMIRLEKTKGILPSNDIQDNLEAALKASFYYYIRYLYNYSQQLGLSNSHHTAIFFFIRENAYGSMFRYNKKGEFNIPYGGISYNRKNLVNKINRLKSELLLKRLSNTVFGCGDFEEFLLSYSFDENDFIFLDPPYDTEFST